MAKGQQDVAAGGGRVFVRRRFASVLLDLARSTDAKAASVDATTLTLTLPDGSREVALEEIDTVETRSLWPWWVGVRIRSVSGDSTVSGLSRKHANEFESDLRAARIERWRQTLAAHQRDLAAADAALDTLPKPTDFIRYRAFEALRESVTAAAAPFPGRWPDGMPDSAELAALGRIRDFLEDPEGTRSSANEVFVADELERSWTFLDGVESEPLNEEQRRAVAVDDDRNLVVAPTASGKTSAMVAKAGWLVEKGSRRAEELLLLASARNARDELAKRVEKRLGTAGLDMIVQTFPELALEIISQAEGRRPRLSKVAGDPVALDDVLGRIIAELLKHRDHGRALVRWLAYGYAPYRSPHEFQSWGAYWDYVRSHDMRSLQGERVKSFEASRIANFLHMNGVAYEYQPVYEHDAGSAKPSQYRPDFHLPESGIYIEHLPLSSDGGTPPFIDQAKFTASRERNRKLHERHGTTLVETFSHEQQAGTLTANLRRKLREHGVEMKPIPFQRAFAVLNGQGRVAPLTKLVATFLQHFLQHPLQHSKGSRQSFEAIRERAARTAEPSRAEAFLQVFEPIYERYQQRLSLAVEIDFHDLIKRATDHVAAGRYRSPFGYILVDGYQDISRGQAALLDALLDQSGSTQLFAVGDDWQAIDRFAGADLDVMRSFGTPPRGGTRSALETTFRCADGVSQVATEFVLANPAQIPREVKPRRHVDGPGVWIGLADGNGMSLLGEALSMIETDLPAESDGTDVLMLGRYRHAKPDMGRLEQAHPSLRLSYSTVHDAKALEADYVVVLGLSAGRHGFPSETADDPLLDLVLAEPERYANAEERRLLYVAMTRARRRTYLIVPGEPASPFVNELLTQDGVGTFGRTVADDVVCRQCGTGRLVRRQDNGASFNGCSNHPYCEYTERG